jgi:hypothetical protein
MFKFKNRAIFAVSSGLVTVTMLVVVGCGSDDTGLGRRYPVSGTVKYKGEPVPTGSITFEPTSTESGRHAYGFIENGAYSLSTSGASGEGALPGDYKVVIISTTVDMRELAKKSGGLVRQGDTEFQQIVKNAQDVVPKKYFRSDTSPLTAKVGERAETINFDLED